MAKLLEKFVTVRVIQGWGLDLSLFQFDLEQTWAVMFLNADRTIYGRYGSRRAKGGQSGKYISMEGFREAMRGALELHGGYPGNKKSLAGKTGPKPRWRTPETIPEVRSKDWNKPADGGNTNCVHCHEVFNGKIETLRKAGRRIRDELLRGYPMPEDIGFSLDPATRATVTAVTPGSPAAKARLRNGDRVVSMEGQPVVSMADVQWVLHHAKDPGRVKVTLDRNGRKVAATVRLPKGWRKKVPFLWRGFSYYQIRYPLLGTMPLEEVAAGERQRLGIPNGGLALRVKKWAPNWGNPNKAARRALQLGDIIVGADGRKGLRTEEDFLGYVFQEKKPGQPIILTVLRSGRPQQVRLPLP